ncbi:MAG TPA: hypothetical protein RMH99_24985 [Sandaracinaceae bacterium LLY-WYZ-13_1]|nr:hypothetical protein [Sandaracinaceae bacterium LLY-WYZ-13_1]
MSRFAYVQMAVWAATVLACGTTEVMLDGGSSPDAGGPTGQLAVESEPALALTFAEGAPIRVRYTEEGSPVSGVPVRFALEGAAHDATLADLSLTTDVDGMVETTVQAGSVASAFRVRVSTDRAAPAHVNVSVSNQGFGPLVVRAVYDGRRTEATRRVLRVYSDTGCDPPGGFPSFPDRMATLDDDEVEEARWGALPAGLSYAVVGRVEGPGGAVLATACKDGVEVTRDEETRVELRFEDARLVLDGRYDLEVSLQPSASVGAATDRAADGGTGLVADAAAGLYLDALEAELRDRGEDATADLLLAERASGTPDASLAGRLEDAGEGPTLAVMRFADALAERLSVVRLGGPLNVDALDGGETLVGNLDVESLEVGAVPTEPDGTPPLALDLAALELELAPSIELAWGSGMDLVRVAPLEVSLPLGTLVAATVEAEAAAVSSPGALLLDGAGCDALAAWVEDDPTVSPVCERDCADAACVRALDDVAEAMSEAALAADEARDRVAVEGSVALSDEDGDLLVDHVEGRGLGGTWTGPLGLESDPLSADVVGERVEVAD